MSRRHRTRALAAAIAVILLPGCGAQVPADPHGTLDTVTGATLHAGGSPHPGFVEVDDGIVTGSEADAVESFADTLDADVQWTIGSEESLVRGLENGTLDIVVAGLTDQTPWAEQAGMTRPYTEAQLEDGKKHALVMLVPIGENDFLTELETFLAGYTGETR
jgi:ABC-type amino acid transport substrate-binding protein